MTRAGGRLSRGSLLEQTLALAIAELTLAERAEDLDRMRERVALARAFVSEALAQRTKRKAKDDGSDE